MKTVRFAINAFCAATGLAFFYYSYRHWNWSKSDLIVSAGVGVFMFFIAYFAVVYFVGTGNEELLREIGKRAVIDKKLSRNTAVGVGRGGLGSHLGLAS